MAGRLARRGPTPRLVTRRELDATLLRELLRVYQSASSRTTDSSSRAMLFTQHSLEPGWQAAIAGWPPVGFAYGFHCSAGQWWRDSLQAGLRRQLGDRTASCWLTDAYCIAELHVEPDWQRRGIGRALVRQLLAKRPESTVVLSTRDDGQAHEFYTRLGFTTLLDAFRFPGTPQPYTVFGSRRRP